MLRRLVEFDAGIVRANCRLLTRDQPAGAQQAVAEQQRNIQLLRCSEHKMEPDPLEFWVARGKICLLSSRAARRLLSRYKKSPKRAKRRYDAAAMKQVPK
jgi:hypothetical protein